VDEPGKLVQITVREETKDIRLCSRTSSDRTQVSMRLVATLVITLLVLPEAVQSEVAIKGEGPVLLDARPDYPYAARNQHMEGSGLFRLNIKPDGNVSSVTVLKSTGHALLDQAAIHAFRQWRFRPGYRDEIKIPIHFTMAGMKYRMQ
jgi:TonB family protein